MLTLEREDRITYSVRHRKRGIVGVITRQRRDRWHVEDYETAEQFVAATLTKARFWLERQKTETV